MTEVFGKHGWRRYENGEEVARSSHRLLAGEVTQDGSAEFGDHELRVEVHGRLVSSTESGLWALRDAITDEADSAAAAGILEDTQGHAWSDMKLLSFEVSGETDRGRRVSIGYTALFGVLAS